MSFFKVFLNKTSCFLGFLDVLFKVLLQVFQTLCLKIKSNQFFKTMFKANIQNTFRLLIILSIGIVAYVIYDKKYKGKISSVKSNKTSAEV